MSHRFRSHPFLSPLNHCLTSNCHSVIFICPSLLLITARATVLGQLPACGRCPAFSAVLLSPDHPLRCFSTFASLSICSPLRILPQSFTPSEVSRRLSAIEVSSTDGWAPSQHRPAFVIPTCTLLLDRLLHLFLLSTPTTVPHRYHSPALSRSPRCFHPLACSVPLSVGLAHPHHHSAVEFSE